MTTIKDLLCKFQVESTPCQYFIKKTNNPRICAKNSTHTKSSFLAQNLRSELDFDIHLCSKHFGMIVDQIKKKITHSAFFNFRYDHSLFSPQFGHNTNEWKFFQLVSVLENCLEKFNRITQISHNPELACLPDEVLELAAAAELVKQRVAAECAEVERQERADDVIFIEEKNENQVLIRKFEEAKRDGRYIDLTEPKRKKQKNTRA